MKKEMKQLLTEAYAPPKAQKKQEFLRKMPRYRISASEFFMTQAAYIRKRVWIISLAFLAAGVLCSYRTEQEILWVVSSFVPFIAVTAMTELMKSVSCGMDELEMTTRFSLRSVLLARLSMIGMFHLIILVVGLPLVIGGEGAVLWRNAVYLVVPYLLTCVLSTFMSGRTGYRESNFICMGCAVLVSGIGMVIRVFLPMVYGAESFAGWIIVLAVLLVCSAREGKRMFQWRITWN